MLDGTSFEIPTTHRLHLAKSAGAIRAGILVCHRINPLRHTLVRTIRGAGYEVEGGSPTLTRAKDLPLHRKREAKKSLKTGPEKRTCSGTEQSQEERFWAAEELHTCSRTVQPEGGRFWAAEELGSEAPRRCQQCRRCNESNLQGQEMTQTEPWEYAEMAEVVMFHPGTRTFRDNYLFTDDPLEVS